MKKLSIFLFSIFVFAGCFHKSVQDGEADNIVKAKIYQFKDGYYLVTLESIFQATSKKSGGGVNVTTGYNDMRITVYDMNTGKIVSRLGTGTMIDHAIEFLGCSEGNIWFYSLDDGLHSREPKTLEIKITQDKFFEKKPDMKDNLAKCEWYQFNQFFQFNDLTKKLFLSDNQGYRYTVDPNTLVFEKQAETFKMPNEHRDDPFETNIKFAGIDISIDGDLRKQIKVRGKEINSSLTFLDGKFIADRDVPRIFNTINTRFQPLKKEYDRLDARKKEMEAANEGKRLRWGDKNYDLQRKVEDSLRDISNEKEELERLIKYITADGHMSSYDQLLSPDSNTFFVFHKTKTAKDANVILSRLQLKNRCELKEMWRVTLLDLFYDPNAAEETDAFKKVFSKGSPDFDFQYIEMTNDKLLVVWMLYAHCIDMKTGKVIWKFEF
ncbi:MAG: hypothetical protein V2A54_10145 [Bacteroidota bacterium]